MSILRDTPPPSPLLQRRTVLGLAAGSAVVALGAWHLLADSDLERAAREQLRDDGRARLPPGQRLLTHLRPMGGTPGTPSRASFHLKVHGDVAHPYTLDFRELVEMGSADTQADVHCVTGWSRLDTPCVGLPLHRLIERAEPSPEVSTVILEAAHGYTANIRLHEALSPSNHVIWEIDGEPLKETHGAPVRALIPDLYFWKSAKWLTGLRFERYDIPGYWERRGYHNHADPWLEERYS